MTITEPEDDVISERRQEGAADAACLFHALSEPNRLAILGHLTLGEHRVVDLRAHLGLAQSTVSKHLACLRDCGLVVSRPSGRASVTSLAHPEATEALLVAADALLAASGRAAAACGHVHAGEREGARVS